VAECPLPHGQHLRGFTSRGLHNHTTRMHTQGTHGPNASLPDPAKRETSRGLRSPLPGHDVLAHPAVPAPPGRTHVRVSVQERPWRPTRCTHPRRRRPGVRLRSPFPRRRPPSVLPSPRGWTWLPMISRLALAK